MRVVHVPDGEEATQGDGTAEGTDGSGGEDIAEGTDHAGGEETVEGTVLATDVEGTVLATDVEGTVLATDVEVADSALAMSKGLRFRSSIPDDYAFVMDVGGGSLGPLSFGARVTTVDMLFVRFPIDVVWLHDGTVVKVKTMHPWRSVGVGKADRIVELPAGAAEDVEVGDAVLVEDSASD